MTNIHISNYIALFRLEKTASEPESILLYNKLGGTSLRLRYLSTIQTKIMPRMLHLFFHCKSCIEQDIDTFVFIIMLHYISQSSFRSFQTPPVFRTSFIFIPTGENSLESSGNHLDISQKQATPPLPQFKFENTIPVLQ